MIRTVYCFLLVLTAGVLTATPAGALQIQQYDAARHDRFMPGTFPAAPVSNPGLWASGDLLAGVGWGGNDNRQGFALISPRHFVGAHHFRPSIGSQVRFLGSDGRVHGLTVARTQTLTNETGGNTDLFVGELSEAIPAALGIPFFPISELPATSLVGREILVYGRGGDGPRLARARIHATGDIFPFTVAGLNQTRQYSFHFNTRTAAGDDCHGEVGDSGSPSFLLQDGWWTLTGVHSAVGESTSRTGTTHITYDSHLGSYRNQIEAILAADGYQMLAVGAVLAKTVRVAGMTLQGEQVTLRLENPGAIPFDVYRSTDLKEWELVASGQAGTTWTGSLPVGAMSAFWRVTPYSLAVR